jgi:hypothetical protein
LISRFKLPQQFMEGTRPMLKVHKVSVFGWVVVTSMCNVMLGAQAGDPKTLLLNKLNEQFAPTKFTADKSGIVTAGAIVALRKDGLLVYTVTVPAAPITVHKNGKLSQGFGDMFKVGMVDGMGREGGSASIPTKTLVAGEKVWVSGFGIEKDSILVQVVTDPYDDGRYFGTLKFLVPKGSIPTPDEAVRMISEVLDPQQGQDQNSQAQDSSRQPASDTSQGAGQDIAASAQGIYLRKDKTSDSMALGPNGVFALVQNGRRYEGNYSVQGEVLTIWGPKIPGQQRCSLVGNVITDPGKTIWEKPALQQGAAATPAAPPVPAVNTAAPSAVVQRQYEDVAPPPPPPAPAPTVSVGQTKDEVTAAFGEPQRKASAGAKEIFFYTDLKMKVTFTSGKVSSID